MITKISPSTQIQHYRFTSDDVNPDSASRHQVKKGPAFPFTEMLGDEIGFSAYLGLAYQQQATDLL